MSWLIRLRHRATGLDWFLIQRQTGNCKSRQCFAWVRTDKTNRLLEVSVLSWSVRVKEEAHKMPEESRGILCRNHKKRAEMILCSVHFWHWLCTISLSKFSTFLIFNPRLCWRKHSPQGPADLSDCLQYPSGAYHHILLLQVNKEYFGSLLMFLPTFIFL